MNEPDGQIAKGGQQLWSIAGAKPAAVFLEADIAHVMRAIFDSPMSSNQAEQALRRGLLWEEVSDEIDDLSRGFPLLGHGACHFGNLCDERPSGSEIAVHFRD